MITAPYNIKLDIFEGPMDLLLYLIKQEELNIYDIPIARITEQYLKFLDLLKALDIDVAGEFLVMAATLIKIKSRMLLPRYDEIEGEPDDPRRDLVRQLLEYKKYKEAASRLEEKESVQRLMFPRPRLSLEGQEDVRPVEDPGLDVSVLLTAFQQVMERVDKVRIYEIAGEDISIEERLDFVIREIGRRGRMTFTELFVGERRRLMMVVTFFALLELIRLGRVRVEQEGLFGEITIVKIDAPAAVAAPAPGA